MKYNQLFLALLAVSSAHGDASRKAFSELDLTEGQPKLLYILKRVSGPFQKELAELCGIRPSTLCVLLGKSEEQGLICKESCLVSGRKRAYRIYLTDKGEEVAEQLEQLVADLEKKGFSGFSEEEKINLLNMLERVEYNMKDK